MTFEYIQKRGLVTCEFHAEELTKDMVKEMGDCNLLLSVCGARWVAFYCETCTEHNNGIPSLHVEIDRMPSLAV